MSSWFAKQIARFGVGGAQAEALASTAPSSGPVSILLVDDDPELALALTPHLEGCGWTVRYARDAADALRLANDGFDLMVVDMMLPRQSGFQVVHHLRLGHVGREAVDLRAGAIQRQQREHALVDLGAVLVAAAAQDHAHAQPGGGGSAHAGILQGRLTVRPRRAGAGAAS